MWTLLAPQNLKPQRARRSRRGCRDEMFRWKIDVNPSGNAKEESRLAWLAQVSLGLHSLVVNPKQGGGGDTDGGDRPPDALRFVLDFAEVVHEPASEASTDQRAYPDGQECEAHIRALLSRRRESRDVF